MKFTDEQRAAIAHDGRNLQLIACAGSGKTEVVAQRVVHLLRPDRSGSLRPENIIAFTFTEKAAAELKDRIFTRTREDLGTIHGLAEMFVGTIHAFCLELLKNEVPRYLKFEVLNQVQQALFVDRYSQASGLTTSTTVDGTRLRRYTDTQNYISALSILRESDLHRKPLAHCSVYKDGLPKYQALLEERSYFDYSSILEKAAFELMNNDEVRSRLCGRIKYVIVDEYQDVNPVQEAIVHELYKLGAGICVVGDDDQTIYQWRGSDVRNIVEFVDRYPDVDRITLAENFRSSKGVVDTARTFIEKNPDRLPKQMTPASTQTYEAGDIVALSFSSPEKEAEYIAETIESLRGVAFGDKERGLSWSDMAVLLRSVRSDAAPITNVLQRAGIPFIVKGMTDLFGAPEAEATRQLFRFVADRDVDRDGVKQAWINADIGINELKLKTALAEVEKVKTVIATATKWEEGSIQRVFLEFLEKAGVREELIPPGRQEIVFYNLGKFSELISDFETIHYKSVPSEKYTAFAGFLEHGAENAYPEGWQENEHASPDAVQIMTVHQAKGMQWPVVFVPALLKNRFPAKKPGGRTEWHLLPREGVKRQARFEGTIEDERRLFYVAMTRSQKFLHFTWAPVPGHSWFQRCSEFWNDILVSQYVKRRRPDYSARKRLAPQPRRGVANVVFSFSELKYFFECPYQFKLRVLCGFNAPIAPALGYGKSLHDALAEVHARAIRGDFVDVAEVSNLVNTHLHTPYASTKLSKDLKGAAEQVLQHYVQDNAEEFNQIEFSEQKVEIHLENGVAVNGRIDLVRRLDTDETTIVDLKSSSGAQAEEVTEVQLHTYALGYQELTGRQADYVEIYELAERRKKPRSVDSDFIKDVKARTHGAARALRGGEFLPAPDGKKCTNCDYRGLCTAGQRV